MSLPKLFGLDRVTVIKLMDDDPEKYNAELYFSHILNYSEVRIMYDCCYKDILVFDFTATKVGHVMKTLPLLRKMLVIAEVSEYLFEKNSFINRLLTQKVYSTRVRAIHLIYAFDLLTNTLKSILKQKLRDRVSEDKKLAPEIIRTNYFSYMCIRITIRSSSICRERFYRRILEGLRNPWSS